MIVSLDSQVYIFVTETMKVFKAKCTLTLRAGSGPDHTGICKMEYFIPKICCANRHRGNETLPSLCPVFNLLSLEYEGKGF